MSHSKRERLEGKYIAYTYYLTNFTSHDDYTLPTYENTIRPLNKNSFPQIFDNTVTYHNNVTGTI